MKSPTVILLAWLCLGCRPALLEAQIPTPLVAREHRCVVVVDTSFSMNRVAPALRRELRSLVTSGVQGRLRAGDILELWVFNEQASVLLAPKLWAPELGQALGQLAVETLNRQRFQKQGHLEKAVLELNRATRRYPTLTAILLTDGEDPVRGTPFDAALNAVFRQRQRELRQARKPFVVAFEAAGGQLVAWASRAAGETNTAAASETPGVRGEQTAATAIAPPPPAAPPETKPGPEPVLPAAPEAKTASVPKPEDRPVAPPGEHAAAAPTPPAARSDQPPLTPVKPNEPTPVPAPERTPTVALPQAPPPPIPSSPPRSEEPAPIAPAKPTPPTPVELPPSAATPPAVVAGPPAKAPVEEQGSPAPTPPPALPRADQTAPGLNRTPLEPALAEAKPTPLTITTVAEPGREKPPPGPSAEAALLKVAPAVSPANGPRAGKTDAPRVETARATNKLVVAPPMALVVPERSGGPRLLYLGLGAGLLGLALGLVYWFQRQERPPARPSLISRSFEKRQ